MLITPKLDDCFFVGSYIDHCPLLGIIAPKAMISPTKDEALKNLTAKPQAIDDKDWARFSEQSKVWITELAQNG